jgi:hypothetical protein
LEDRDATQSIAANARRLEHNIKEDKDEDRLEDRAGRRRGVSDGACERVVAGAGAQLRVA